MLQKTEILVKLRELGLNTPIHLHLFSSIGSTNQFLRQLAPSARLEVCCAEEQTRGKGRFGRQWLSPFGENVYCSLRYALPFNWHPSPSLSLVIALAVLASLPKDLDIQIKWPNDLLWSDKKLGGILIELIEMSGESLVIIGIGLNINTDTSMRPSAFPGCSLYEITKKKYDRNYLIAHLIYNSDLYLKQFLDAGWAAFLPLWETFDYLKDRFVTVSHLSGTKVYGKSLGVNKKGELSIEDETGTIHFFNGGEVSLKDLMLE